MRITTRLKIIATATAAALLVLVPVLVWSLVEFRSAKRDYILAGTIKDTFFLRASLRDQYFLYREDRLRAQWDENKAVSDGMLDQAARQFADPEELLVLERLGRYIEESAETFHRIVQNTAVLRTATGNRQVYEELDKRLYSQLLLKAAAIRDTVTTLEKAGARRVERTYQRLTAIVGVFAITLALSTILLSAQMGRVIRKRLAPLHAGARIIANGNLDYRIKCDGADEFTELTHSINQMTDELQVFTRRLEAEVGAHEQAETALRDSEERLQLAVSGTGMASWDWHIQTGDLLFSSRWAEILGFALEELPPRVESWESRVCPDDLPRVMDKLDRHFRGDTPFYESEHRVRHRAGHWVWVQGRGKVVEWDDDGKPVRAVGTALDITERKLAEEKLRLAASVFTHAREGITITAPDGTIIDVNDSFTRITGYPREEVLGRNPRILKSDRQGAEFYAAMWRELIGKGRWYGEIWNRRKSGEVFAEMLTISAVPDDQGNTRHYVALFSDITALKEHERQLERIAHYDALTLLPNRVLLADRLRQAMAQAQRRGHRLVVIYLDLDGFKTINDNYGHGAGDQLLVAVASRMNQSLRQIDTLSRLGGDEFVAVLLDLPDIETSLPMLTRLLAAASQPVQVGELVLQVSASLGVTFYPQLDEVDAEQLLRQADQAMYQAKLAGKNRYHIFDAEQDRSIRGYNESLDRIRVALNAGEFVLYFQPKVNMRKGAVVGAEALIRWLHPERGLLPPGVFLPVIENHPLAIEVGEWVIDRALTQMEEWDAAGLIIPVSVNIGARQLQRADFVERLGTLLAAHPAIDPTRLDLEVLETSALEDLARISKVIGACNQFGVTFSLDDFGTGYSSLTYLKSLPVMQLKIDQSFVRGMLDDPEDLAILEGVLGLSVAFRREVIAEGVETLAHGELLLLLGCELAQGYSIARPMPAHELPGWVANWRPEPAWANLPAASRDDLPLLFAGVEHRAWVVSIEAYLTGKGSVPPPLEGNRCRFGGWLHTEGQARYGRHAVFESIDRLHRQVHALAVELIEQRARAGSTDPLARLGELHSLRDALLAQLKILVQSRGRTAGTDESATQEQENAGECKCGQ